MCTLQRITIEEAQSICEGQDMKMATYGPEIKACEQKKQETKLKIRSHKSQIEKLSIVTREMKKEQEDREAKGKRDERAEEGCRRFVCFSNSQRCRSKILSITLSLQNYQCYRFVLFLIRSSICRINRFSSYRTKNCL